MSYTQFIGTLLRRFRVKNINVLDSNILYNIRTCSGSNVDNFRKSSSKNNNVLSSDANIFGKLKEPLEQSSNNNVISPISSPHAESFDDDKSEWDDDVLDESEEIVDEKKKPNQYYIREMKRLNKEKKLKEALELYLQMKKNKVFPKKFIYTYLIGACGKAGYTKMAFKLFKQMRDRGIIPSPATLTGLFNACAESPFPEHALEKAHHLREKIIENNWVLSTITYHSMIKAFGKCGDLKTAFMITDEMKQAGHSLTDETFCFLLMSCISDKEAGFTHAIQVFRKMKKFRIIPNIYIYNLLLRAVRDCGIGPPETAMSLLLDWNPKKGQKIKLLEEKIMTTNYLANKIKSVETDHPLNDTNYTNLIETKEDTSVEKLKPTELNLLVSRPLSYNNVIGLENVQKPEDRLLIIGGMDGIISNMTIYKIKPDIKTISILLECIPSTLEAENSLLLLMEKNKIKPDIDFFNLLIKRRKCRHNLKNALEVLDLLHKYNLKVNLVTYGVLALNCTQRSQGKRLIEDMKEAEIQPSIEIMGALVKSAIIAKDFRYLIDMMNAVKEFGIKPDSKLLEDLEKARKLAHKIQMDESKGEYVNKEQLKWCRIFCLQYKPWLCSTEFEQPEHPWNQYRVKI